MKKKRLKKIKDQRIEKETKGKKKIIKIILIIAICFAIIGGFLTTIIISGKRAEERIKNISFLISKDYSYFDVNVDDFYDKIEYKFKNYNKTTSNLEKYDKDGYQYLITLSNNDDIYIKVKSDKIIEIKYDFVNNIEAGQLGYFMGVFLSNSINNFDEIDMKNNVYPNFLENSELWKRKNTSYVYKHLLFDMNLEFDDEDEKYITGAYFIFKPVKEDSNEEYQGKIKIEREKQEAEEKRKKEEKLKREAEEKASAQAKIEQEERERKEKLAQKERTFTAGIYTVGTDIEPGTYNMVAVSGRGNCYVKSNSSVIETFTPGGDRWAIDNYKNVVLTTGGTIEVTSTLQIKFQPVE